MLLYIRHGINIRPARYKSVYNLARNRRGKVPFVCNTRDAGVIDPFALHVQSENVINNQGATLPVRIIILSTMNVYFLIRYKILVTLT